MAISSVSQANYQAFIIFKRKLLSVVKFMVGESAM